MNTIDKTYIGLHEPACILVAQRLIERGMELIDHPTIIVVPTREAARLLKERLAIESTANKSQGAFVSPRIIPVGQLISASSPNQASAAQELAAWNELLKKAPYEAKAVFGKIHELNETSRFKVAERLQKLFALLLQEAVTIGGTAWQNLTKNDKRWLGLEKLYQLHSEILHKYQLSPKSYKLAVENHARIILACVPTLPQAAQRCMQCADVDVEIWLHAQAQHEDYFDLWGRPTAAWQTDLRSHDLLGMKDSAWKNRININLDIWAMAENAAACANACSKQGDKQLHQVALGVCDINMESALEEELEQHGVAAYRPRGISYKGSVWNLLLRLVSELHERLKLGEIAPSDTDNYPAIPFMELLKLPLLQLAQSQNNASAALHALCTIQGQSAPSRVATLRAYCDTYPLQDTRFGFHEKREKAAASLKEMIDSTAVWLAASLQSPQNLLTSLRELASQQECPVGNHTGRTAQKVHATLSAQMLNLCDNLLKKDELVAQQSLSSMILLIQNSANDFSARLTPKPNSLDINGWIELAYNPARSLVITGMHEGVIPEKWSIDSFLSPSAREILGLQSNEQKAARDCYLLCSMLACRQNEREGKAVYFFYANTGVRGETLAPSSILFKLCPEQNLAELVRHCFVASSNNPSTEALPFDDEGWDFHKLPLADLKTSELAQLSFADLELEHPMKKISFSPSMLADFLACPLRFWLKKMHKLSDDKQEANLKELDSMAMGNCIHAAMEMYVHRYPSYAALKESNEGLPEKANRKYPQLLALVQEGMKSCLDLAYEKLFGDAQLIPLQLQKHEMEQMVEHYAGLHLDLWAEGWECARDAEGKLMLEYETNWQLDGHHIRMKIDRVDTRIDEHGQIELRVIDYKTGKGIKSCEASHLQFINEKKGQLLPSFLNNQLQPSLFEFNKKWRPHRWVSLQLPLYTYWVQEHFSHAKKISAAYIKLSGREENCNILPWGLKTGVDMFTPIDEEEEYDSKGQYRPILVNCPPDTGEMRYQRNHFENAKLWIHTCMKLIEEGRCFVWAERLNWPIAHDHLFDEMVKQQNIADIFTKTSQED